MSLDQKNILITGGSRGLGRALALQAASQGARTVLVARGREALDQVVDEIHSQGGQAWGLTADLGDKQAIHRIGHEAAALAGPIDILIQAASTLGPLPMPLLLDTDCEDLEAVLQTNLVGPFRLAKLVVGSMALRGKGLVVSISSDAAVKAYPGWGSYGLSKAALDHLSRIFAAELGELGLRFLAVDPGEMDTRMHADAMPEADPSTLARPEDIALRILDMVRDEERAANGSRIQAPAWELVR